jgi:hypothetical protein
LRPEEVFTVLCTSPLGRIKAAEEDLKNQRQLLESTQKISSKRESSFNMMIFSAVAHAAALFKNHLPDLNMELLHQDFTVDDTEHEALVTSAFDAAQDFISSYDFASLAESDDNDSPRLCNFLLLHARWTSCILITTVYEKYIEDDECLNAFPTR